jgi:hypothetical protein
MVLSNQQLKEKYNKLSGKLAKLDKRLANYMKNLETLIPDRFSRQEEYDKVWRLAIDLNSKQIVPLKKELAELEKTIITRFINVE